LGRERKPGRRRILCIKNLRKDMVFKKLFRAALNKDFIARGDCHYLKRIDTRRRRQFY
jgi:hypothetical protein